MRGRQTVNEADTNGGRHTVRYYVYSQIAIDRTKQACLAGSKAGRQVAKSSMKHAIRGQIYHVSDSMYICYQWPDMYIWSLIAYILYRYV